MSDSPQSRFYVPHWGWFLSGTVALVIAAFGLSIWVPYRQEQQIIAAIRNLGGKVRRESFDSYGLAPFLTPDQLKVFDRVTEVWCSDTAITDEGVLRLTGLNRLKHLGLGRTPISDGALAYLNKTRSLESLYVDGTTISDSGLAHLSGLTKLKRLSLTKTPVSENGLVHLNGLKDLELLWLERTRVSDEGLATLQLALPDCQINR